VARDRGILTRRKGGLAMFSRVVLATDFSAHSEKSYAVGHALAKRFGSKLFVLHVVETSHWTTYSEPLAELGLRCGSVSRRTGSTSSSAMASAIRACRSSGSRARSARRRF
jgi:hypothetical protein